MRLYSVKETRHGMVIGKSLYLPDGNLLLGAGFRITEKILKSLIDRGYTHLYIMEKGTDEIIPEDVISEELRQRASSQLAAKVTELRGAIQLKDLTYAKAKNLLENGYLQQFNIAYELRQIVREILDEISTTGASFMRTLMTRSKGTFFFDHAVNTTVMAILIGAKYRFVRKELTSLALGTMLHDIGKIVLEQVEGEDVHDTSAPLYREHPTFGYLMVRNSPGITSVEAQIVNQHHELQNGTGFPIGLKGRNQPPTHLSPQESTGYIFRFAEIACVANVFDNLLANPMRAQCMTPEEAIKKMIADSGTLYNRDIIQTLHRVIPLYPLGTRVEIIDIVDPNLLGCFGFVAKINEDKLNSPVIIVTTDKRGRKMKPLMLDTSQLTRLELKLVL